jgi:fatty-acyl-CoA synthase
VEPQDVNVASWIRKHAATCGSRTALADAERKLDYTALDSRISRCASVLEARGIGSGDRVALLLGNRTAFVEVVIAAAQLGAITVPLNARLTAWEIRRQLDDCTPVLLVTDRDHADIAEDACDGAQSPPRSLLRCGDEPDAYETAIAAVQPRSAIERVDPDHPMMILYTSGTTGTPKGALLPHRKTLYNGRNAERFFGIVPEDRVLVMLPLFHSFGLSILTLPALQAGASVTLQPRFDPMAVWETVEREGISFFGGVPTMFQRLLDSLDSATNRRYDLSSLRFLFTSGAAIPVERVRDFERHGLVLKQGYGQTETSTLCCLEARDAVRKAGSVGRPVEHAEIRIVTVRSLDGPVANWIDAAVGEAGEVVVKGPITMLGYWQRPDETAETLRGEWLRTHDLASVDDEGFVTLVGRANDLYISGGENVYPAEVEAVFGEHPAVREIAVIGIRDERWGETGRAYVVWETEHPSDADALLAWGRERLAVFKLPSEFVSVAVLPRTVSGKVQKHRLPGAEDASMLPASS